MVQTPTLCRSTEDGRGAAGLGSPGGSEAPASTCFPWPRLLGSLSARLRLRAFSLQQRRPEIPWVGRRSPCKAPPPDAGRGEYFPRAALGGGVASHTRGGGRLAPEATSQGNVSGFLEGCPAPAFGL